MIKLLVCRVGWMGLYAGLGGRDRIVGGGRYVKEHGFGYEIYNFLKGRPRVYGYVQVKGTNNLERLGAEPGADRVEGVTVVWAARRPAGGVYVVGWYRNATVFREYQLRPNDVRRKNPRSRGLLGWNICAQENDAHLLSDEKRVFKLPVGRNALGSSLTCYFDGATKGERLLRERLLRYVGSDGKGSVLSRQSRGRGAGYQTDPEVRAQVERAAINCVRKWYEDNNYKVEGVENERRGWDLEARRDEILLRVEVKGCSTHKLYCELTPNEYEKVQKYSDSYQLCIVASALSRRPSLKRFRFIPERGCWLSDEDVLTLTEKTGAIASVK